MTRLLDLPDELIVHVINYCPPSAHFDVAITCTRCFACSREVLALHRQYCRQLQKITDHRPRRLYEIIQVLETNVIAAYHVRDVKLPNWAEIYGPARDSYPGWLQDTPSAESVDQRSERTQRTRDWLDELVRKSTATPGLSLDYHPLQSGVEEDGSPAMALLLALCTRARGLKLSADRDGWEIEYGVAVLSDVIAKITSRPSALWPCGLRSLRDICLGEATSFSEGYRQSICGIGDVAHLMSLPGLKNLRVCGMSASGLEDTYSVTRPSAVEHLHLELLHFGARRDTTFPPGYAKAIFKLLRRTRVLRTFALIPGWFHVHREPLRDAGDGDVVSKHLLARLSALDRLTFALHLIDNGKTNSSLPHLIECQEDLPRIALQTHLIVQVDKLRLSTPSSACLLEGGEAPCRSMSQDLARTLLDNIPQGVTSLELVGACQNLVCACVLYRALDFYLETRAGSPLRELSLSGVSLLHSMTHWIQPTRGNSTNNDSLDQRVASHATFAGLVVGASRRGVRLVLPKRLAGQDRGPELAELRNVRWA